MKRRLLAILLVATMSFTVFTACGNSSDGEYADNDRDDDDDDDDRDNDGDGGGFWDAIFGSQFGEQSTMVQGTEIGTEADTEIDTEVDTEAVTEVVPDDPIIDDPVTEPTISENIVVYVPDMQYEVTRKALEEYLASSEKYKNCTLEIYIMSTYGGLSYSGSDLFLAGTEYIDSMAATGGVQSLSDADYPVDYDFLVMNQTDEAAVSSVTVDGEIYGFPASSNNGFYMYYDKSVISNPDSLEAIIADCKASGKKISFDNSNMWYVAAFFMGTGCKAEASYNDYGDMENFYIDYNSAKGMVAYRELCELVNSGVVADDPYAVSDDIAVYITGIWMDPSIKDMLGDNCGATILPQFVGCDGNAYRMKAYSGHYCWGVTKQSSDVRTELCLELANYLSSYEVQEELFLQNGIFPSNLDLQRASIISSDETYVAMSKQMSFAVPQKDMPYGYWDVISRLPVLESTASDADYMSWLDYYVSGCTVN